MALRTSKMIDEEVVLFAHLQPRLLRS